MARRKTLGRKSSKSRNKKRKRTYRKTRRMRGGGDKLTILEQADLKRAALEKALLEKRNILDKLKTQMALASLLGKNKNPESISQAEEELIRAEADFAIFLEANPGKSSGFRVRPGPIYF